MKLQSSLLFLSWLLMEGAAGQPTTMGNYVGCLTEKSFDAFISAQIRKDTVRMKHLLDTQCFIIREGVPLEIIEIQWAGKAKVRSAANGAEVDFWINADAFLLKD